MRNITALALLFILFFSACSFLTSVNSARIQSSPLPVKTPVAPTPTASPSPTQTPSVNLVNKKTTCLGHRQQLAQNVCYGIYTINKTAKAYVVSIKLKDPAVKINAKPANRIGRLATVSYAARRYGAVVAVNASFFRGGIPIGPVANNGRWICRCPHTSWVFILNKDGTSNVAHTNDFFLEENRYLQNSDIIISGGNKIIQNGRIVYDFGPDNKQGILYRQNARTAIAASKDGFLYLIVVEKSSRSRGVTIPTLRNFILLLNPGIHNAINLDGGGSTTMVINNKAVNTPRYGSQRRVSTVIFITSDNK